MTSSRDATIQQSSNPTILRVVLVGLVIAIGLAALWYFTRPAQTVGPSAAPKAKPSAAISQVDPQLSTNKLATQNAAKSKPKKTKKELDEEFIRLAEARYGTNMPPGLKTHIYYLKNPPKQVYSGMLSYPYLKHTSERDIASVVLVTPGTTFLEPTVYGDDFDQDFMTAFLDPIKPEPGDTDEIKAQKEQIEQLKKEIAKLVKETGKKPSEIMTEQSQLMFDLGRFEEGLAEDLREAENDPNLTDDDVKDMFRAANELRKKKGLEEREVPTLTRRALQLKRAARRAAREAMKKASENKE